VTTHQAARKRKVSSNARRFQVLIFAEGKETEPVYFTNWYRQHRDRIIVKVAPHQNVTTPMELVRRAIKQRAGDLRESKRGLGDAYDEYWCVFDVDTHPYLNEALQLARSEDIRVALSNPCIELWITIHFQDQTAYLSTEAAEEKAAVLLGCGKAPTPTALERLVERYNDAKERARQLDKKHENHGSPPNSNPSTGVWRLVDIIKGDQRYVETT
jgi:RloB-like protein